MHFFRPQTHGLYSDQCTTGYASPSEVPVLYYFIAILYKIFGYHELIFRAVNLIIFYLGLYYLFRLACLMLNDLFFSAIVLALIFTSPVLVYYGNNFLPNTVALSFSLIGWYHFYRYHLHKKTGTLLLSMLFFGIAGLLKITELTGLLIILVLMLADRLKITSLKLVADRDFIPGIISILLIFTAIAGWLWYAKAYNNQHGSIQFSTHTYPYWRLGKAAVDNVFHKMHTLWFADYFYPPTLYGMIACIPFTAVFLKRSDKLLSVVSLFLILAVVAFSLLWFQALADHDYFFIGFYVLPAFLFINFFVILKSLKLKIVYQRIIQVVLIGVTFVNLLHAHERQLIRYNSWMNDYPEMQDVYTIKPWLREQGIHERDTVVFYPGVNIRALYLMNLKGWPVADHTWARPKDQLPDSVLMGTFLANGAKYLITNNINSLMAYPLLLPYAKDLYGKYGSVYIFRIPPQQDNFNPDDEPSPDS